MSQKQLHLARPTYPMCLYIRRVLVPSALLTEIERAFLSTISRDHTCLAWICPCSDATHRMGSFTAKQNIPPEIDKISNHTILPVDLMCFAIRGDCRIGVAKEYISTNTPGQKVNQIEGTYFITDLYPTNLGEYLDKMSRRLRNR